MNYAKGTIYFYAPEKPAFGMKRGARLIAIVFIRNLLLRTLSV